MDKELLNILACPACRGKVELKENRLHCKKCARIYPVRDGIPVMLVEEAQKQGGNNGQNTGNPRS